MTATFAQPGPTTAEKIRKLPWSIASNAANVVFSQLTFFGSIFILFLDQLSLDKTQIGFLLSLIPFSSLIALFVAPTIARFGYKRTYLTFLAMRKIVTAFLLLTPWVIMTFGGQATVTFIAAVVVVFALCRALAITAFYPWVQEYVPSSVRGKYSATNSIFSTLAGLVILIVAGQVLEWIIGLTGFMILIGIGVLFGFFCVWAASFIPGGGPVPRTETTSRSYQDLFQVLRDRNFVLYLGGLGLISLATIPVNAFLPLFMQEEVGLSTGHIILLQAGVMVGSLSSSYLWGWAADRYGSKPVMISGVGFLILLPLSWMLMPRNIPASLYVALGIAFVQGIATMGWAIGSARLLYVRIVPPEHKTAYMSVFYSGSELIAAISQLSGGWVLMLFAGVSGQFLIFTLDPYTVLFAVGMVLPVISVFVFRQVQADNTVSVREFANLFLRGNPLMAMESLVRYHFTTTERDAVSVTERLGQARSGLTVDELLEALEDPRFNVRFEAIVSIARTRSDPRLTEALIGILNGSEVSLSVVSAWALGRIGDEKAIAALRDGLNAPYRSIQAHAARALGTMGDQDSKPMLLDRLQTETDKGLEMAFASALGNLEAAEAVPELLRLLEEVQNPGARMELALSLARIAGHEGKFIQRLRQSKGDKGTSFSQTITGLKRKLERLVSDQAILRKTIEACADAFARDDLDGGVAKLVELVELLPVTTLTPEQAQILAASTKVLGETGATYLDYLLLTFHILETGWEKS